MIKVKSAYIVHSFYSYILNSTLLFLLELTGRAFIIIISRLSIEVCYCHFFNTNTQINKMQLQIKILSIGLFTLIYDKLGNEYINIEVSFS